MNYYARAIDVIIDPETDFRAMVIEIAKRHPKVVCDVAVFSPWEKQCLPFIHADKKIHAIKLCRELTGWTLTESKEAVEALMERLGA
jgi:hypothetical protein